MATMNKVSKLIAGSKEQAIKYQILTYCYLNNISVTDADLDLLTLLAQQGEQELNSFCLKASEANIFKSAQSVRNALLKIESKGLIGKEGKSKKRLTINEKIGIQTQGNLLLEYKFVALETA